MMSDSSSNADDLSLRDDAYLTAAAVDGLQGDIDDDDDDELACQYWRDLMDILKTYPKFVNVKKPLDILTVISDLISDVESIQKKENLCKKLQQLMVQKDKNINKLQKRNESLTNMLSENLKRKTSSETLDKGVSQNLPNTNDASKEGIPPKDNVVLEKKYSELLQDRESLYGHWKTVTNERDSFKEKYAELESQCAELNKQLNNQGTSFTSALSNIPGEKIVILKRDQQGKCGIRFGRPKKVPLLLESYTVISGVKHGIPNFSEIGVGDFVIEVNNTNVQHLLLDEVTDLSNDDGDLILKLRSSNTSIENKTVTGTKNSFEQWGLTLGVFVKNVDKSSYAETQGIREKDEIIRVNSQGMHDLLHKKVYYLMNKEVQIELSCLSDPSEQIYSVHRLSMSSTSTTRSSNIRQSKTRIDTALPPISSSATSSHYNMSQSDNVSINSGRSGGSPSASIERKLSGESDPYSSGGYDPYGSGNNSSDSDTRYETKEIKKADFKPFGWTLIGGNKVGIFIKSIENWSPVSDAGLQIGWKLLSVDDTNFENVAFSFAMDYLSSLRERTNIKVKVEKIPSNIYSQECSRRPYDTFYIKAIVDYRGRSNESSFKKGEVFCITNSSSLSDDGKTLRWTGKENKTENTITIPSQKARFRLYEGDTTEKKRPIRYYEILDNVDIAEKTYAQYEDVGAF